ncbi:MAG: alpha/beta fold hydrolase [Mariprofundaceae bacterium]
MTDMVFIHGWGQSASVWFEQQCFANARFINLPGHGGAPDAPDTSTAEDTATAWLETLAARLPEQPCILIGWSLGGMLAMQLAHSMPAKLAGLVLVGSTPCFTRKADWQHGCDTATFTAFEQGINAPEKERLRALSRFFALMLHGDALSRQTFNQLARRAVDRHHPASPTGLTQGLSLLAEMDLRPIVGHLAVPTLVMHGEQDAIVPLAAGRELASQIAQADWHGFTGCGHAPFLSQPQQFNDTLEEWCQKL